MKSIKCAIAQVPMLAFALIFSAQIYVVSAGDLAVKTGDRGILSIVIAAAAFIMTAIITTKLTKHKNK